MLGGERSKDAVKTVETKLTNATAQSPHDKLTPSVAWLSISRRPPDELYRGVTVSVGGFGAAKKTITMHYVSIGKILFKSSSRP